MSSEYCDTLQFLFRREYQSDDYGKFSHDFSTYDKTDFIENLAEDLSSYQEYFEKWSTRDEIKNFIQTILQTMDDENEDKWELINLFSTTLKYMYSQNALYVYFNFY